MEREIDIYWRREARNAYAERVKRVQEALAENGGIILPWMQYSIAMMDIVDATT